MSCEAHRTQALAAILAAHPGRGLTEQDAELIYQTHRRKTPGVTYEKFTAGLEAGLQLPEQTIAEALPVQESPEAAQKRLDALRADDPERMREADTERSALDAQVDEAMTQFGRGEAYTTWEQHGNDVTVLNALGVVSNLRFDADGQLKPAPVFTRCPKCGSENVYRQERADGSDDETQGECDDCQHRGPIEAFHLQPWDVPQEDTRPAILGEGGDDAGERNLTDEEKQELLGLLHATTRDTGSYSVGDLSRRSVLEAKAGEAELAEIWGEAGLDDEGNYVGSDAEGDGEADDDAPGADELIPVTEARDWLKEHGWSEPTPATLAPPARAGVTALVQAVKSYLDEENEYDWDGFEWDGPDEKPTALRVLDDNDDIIDRIDVADLPPRFWAMLRQAQADMKASPQTPYEQVYSLLHEIAPGYDGGGKLTREVLQEKARAALAVPQMRESTPPYIVEALEAIESSEWNGQKMSREWMTRLANQAIDAHVAIEDVWGEDRVARLQITQHNDGENWHVQDVQAFDAEGREVPPTGYAMQWAVMTDAEQRAALDEFFPKGMAGPTSDPRMGQSGADAPDFLRPGVERYTMQVALPAQAQPAAPQRAPAKKPAQPQKQPVRRKPVLTPARLPPEAERMGGAGGAREAEKLKTANAQAAWPDPDKDLQRAPTLRALPRWDKGVAWRTTSGQSVRGLSAPVPQAQVSAADVVRYEQDELGNDNGVPKAALPELEKMPASRLVWVTSKKAAAKQYNAGGGLESFNLTGCPIVGEDGEDGYLVLLPGQWDDGRGYREPQAARKPTKRPATETTRSTVAKKAAKPKSGQGADLFKMLPSGAIADQHGAILYEAESIKDLSRQARKRLAELHTADDFLDWEHAEDILIREKLLKLAPPSEKPAKPTKQQKPKTKKGKK